MYPTRLISIKKTSQLRQSVKKPVNNQTKKQFLRKQIFNEKGNASQSSVILRIFCIRYIRQCAAKIAHWEFVYRIWSYSRGALNNTRWKNSAIKFLESIFPLSIFFNLCPQVIRRLLVTAQRWSRFKNKCLNVFSFKLSSSHLIYNRRTDKWLKILSPAYLKQRYQG